MNNKKHAIPDCKGCIKNRVALLPENFLAYSIIEKYNVLFSDGMGGINISSIKDVVKLYNLDAEEELITIHLIMMFYKTAKEVTGDK